MQTTLLRPVPLTVSGVFATLRRTAGEKGPGSTNRRQRAVLQLLRSCRDCETRYLVRTLAQVMRNARTFFFVFCLFLSFPPPAQTQNHLLFRKGLRAHFSVPGTSSIAFGRK